MTEFDLTEGDEGYPNYEMFLLFIPLHRSSGHLEEPAFWTDRGQFERADRA
jgi:hypothetical protein